MPFSVGDEEGSEDSKNVTWIGNCIVDKTGTYMAICGVQGTACIRAVSDGRLLQALDQSAETQGVCFDYKGSKMAYFVRPSYSGKTSLAKLVLCKLSRDVHSKNHDSRQDVEGDPWVEVKRFEVCPCSSLWLSSSSS